jgi:hypothetical protein
VSLVEIVGWAGTGFNGRSTSGHDVIIALDGSGSTWLPSGSDIDGDGRVGTRRRRVRLGPFMTTDAGDTIYQAQVLAASRLIERLEPSRVRIGLITFAGSARMRAPLGSTKAELADALQLALDPTGGLTNFKILIQRAVEEFERLEDEGGARQRSLLFLSDGTPRTGTKGRRHELAFVEVAARRAAKAGVRIFCYAVGAVATSDPEAFKVLARITAGDLFLIENPADVVENVPYLSLTRIDRVEIDNLSSSARARSVRVFPDGSFDAYAPLQPGLNILRISVFGEDGGSRVLDRRVYFERIPANSPTRVAEARRLLRDLKIRTIEMELARIAREKRRRARWRELEIQVDD